MTRGREILHALIMASRILPRYQRQQDKINEMVRNMFLAGVGTRRVGEILAEVGGEKISAQTVSRIAQSLDAEADRFRRQSITEPLSNAFSSGSWGGESLS